jgi:hypothetical protein
VQLAQAIGTIQIIADVPCCAGLLQTQSTPIPLGPAAP